MCMYVCMYMYIYTSVVVLCFQKKNGAKGGERRINTGSV